MQLKRLFIALAIFIYADSILFANPDSLRAIALCQQAMKVVYTNKDSAIYYGYEAMKIGKEIKRRNIEAYAHNVIGIAFDVSAVYDSSLFHYRLAFDIAEELGKKNTAAAALNNIGLTYWNRSQYDEAIDYFEQSIVRFEVLENHGGIGNTLNNIGLIIWEQDQFEKALEYYRAAIEKYKLVKNEYGISAAYANIGNAFNDLGLLDSSIYYLSKAIDYKIKVEDHYGLGIVYHNLGGIYSENNLDRDTAIVYLNMAIEEATQVNDKKRIVASHFNLGLIYKKLDKNKKAKYHYRQAIAIGEKESIPGEYYQASYGLGELLGKEGDYKNAVPLLQSAYALHDSIYTLERDQKILEITKRYENEKTEKELLAEKANSAQIALKVANRNKWLIGLAGALVTLFLYGYSRMQKNRRLAQAEKAEALLQERDRGLKAVIDAQEDERKRIAKDLHDGIGQQLSGLKMAWTQLANELGEQSPEAGNKVKTLSNILEQSVTEVRSISHQMMPKALQDLGLVPAIADMLEKTFLYSEIKYNFEHFKADCRFDEHVEIGLFRICQELINNCVKHSEANEVSIYLNFQAPFLNLLVEDNGKGIDENKKVEGMGFVNIQSRLNAISGQINYESNSDGGTLASVSLRIRE